MATHGGRSRTEVRHALKNLRRWVRPRRVKAPLTALPGRAWYQYEPLGVVLVVGAWNYPPPHTGDAGARRQVSAIVTASADVEVAARRIAHGKLLNSGQTCVAPDHVLVEQSVRDAFVDALVGAMREFSGGKRLATAVLRKPSRSDPRFVYPPYGRLAEKIMRKVL